MLQSGMIPSHFQDEIASNGQTVDYLQSMSENDDIGADPVVKERCRKFVERYKHLVP